MATSKVLLGLLVFSQSTLASSDPQNSPGRDFIIGARAKSVTLLYNLDRNVLKSDPSQTANGTYSDLYTATAVPSVWTQQTADSNYAVAVESAEGIIENGTTKNMTFLEFPLPDHERNEPDAKGLESATVYENYFPERIVYLKGSAVVGGKA